MIYSMLPPISDKPLHVDRDMPIEPGGQVGQHPIALRLVEDFVIEPFVKVKCLVGRARLLIKPDCRRAANPILATVQDQQRYAQRSPLFQTRSSSREGSPPPCGP